MEVAVGKEKGSGANRSRRQWSRDSGNGEGGREVMG